MSQRPPLEIFWRSPTPPLPVEVIVGREREGRTLSIVTRELRMHAPFFASPLIVPRGYVTDWASIPALAQWRIQPMGRHALAALGHDYCYAIGEPGRRAEADRFFLERMKLDGVNPIRAQVMFQAVRLGGGGGYAQAARWWDEQNFRDARTGSPCAPPYAREAAFGWGKV